MDHELKMIVQRAICKMNREQDKDPCCIWSEIEGALLECGEEFGCDLEARVWDSLEIYNGNPLLT